MGPHRPLLRRRLGHGITQQHLEVDLGICDCDGQDRGEKLLTLCLHHLQVFVRAGERSRRLAPPSLQRWRRRAGRRRTGAVPLIAAQGAASPWGRRTSRSSTSSSSPTLPISTLVSSCSSSTHALPNSPVTLGRGAGVVSPGEIPRPRWTTSILTAACAGCRPHRRSARPGWVVCRWGGVPVAWGGVVVAR